MSVKNLPQEPERQPSIEDLIPAYVLGAAEAGEAAAVQRAASDPQVGADLAAYGELADALLYAVPAAEPPPGLAAKLRASLGGAEAEPSPVVAAPVIAPPPAPLPAPAPEAAKPRRVWQWPLITAIAASLLLLLLNLYWLREVSTLRQSHVALQQQMSEQANQFMARMLEQENILQAQQQQINQRDELVTTLVTNASERYAMHAVDPNSAAVANVAWLQNSNTAILRAQNFPVLEEGKEYQLWLISGDKRTSGGLFTVDDYGCATIVFHPDAALDDFDGMGITPEPAGGSPGPTAPPVVRTEHKDEQPL